MKNESVPEIELTAAATVAGEDLASGDYVSLLNETVDLPSFRMRQVFLAKGTGSVCRAAARRVLRTNGACPLCRQETWSDPSFL
jgi:hypothetical protein